MPTTTTYEYTGNAVTHSFNDDTWLVWLQVGGAGGGGTDLQQPSGRTGGNGGKVGAKIIDPPATVDVHVGEGGGAPEASEFGVEHKGGNTPYPGYANAGDGSDDDRGAGGGGFSAVTDPSGNPLVAAGGGGGGNLEDPEAGGGGSPGGNGINSGEDAPSVSGIPDIGGKATLSGGGWRADSVGNAGVRMVTKVGGDDFYSRDGEIYQEDGQDGIVKITEWPKPDPPTNISASLDRENNELELSWEGGKDGLFTTVFSRTTGGEFSYYETLTRSTQTYTVSLEGQTREDYRVTTEEGNGYVTAYTEPTDTVSVYTGIDVTVVSDAEDRTFQDYYFGDAPLYYYDSSFGGWSNLYEAKIYTDGSWITIPEVFAENNFYMR